MPIQQDSPSTQALATFLVEHRQKAGLSQESLAAALHVSAGYIAHIEKGRRRIAPDKAVEFAEAVGLDLAECRRFERLRQQVRVDEIRRTLAEEEARLAELVSRER